MRLNLVAPLLLCITEPSPKFYRLACESITRLLTKGFFDPPGIGFVPSNHVTSSSCRQDNKNNEDTNVIREIRDEVSTLPILDFVLGYLCECFPPTIDPSSQPTPEKIGTASNHGVIRDFHKTLIKAFEKTRRNIYVQRLCFELFGVSSDALSFLFAKQASNTMMIRASEDGRSPAIVDWFKKRTG